MLIALFLECVLCLTWFCSVCLSNVSPLLTPIIIMLYEKDGTKYTVKRNVHVQLPVLIYKGCLACCLCKVMGNLWYSWVVTSGLPGSIIIIICIELLN